MTRRPSLNLSNLDSCGRSMLQQVLRPTDQPEHNVVFRVRNATDSTISIDNWDANWNDIPEKKGFPAPYWKGATCLVLTGEQRNKTFAVIDSDHAGHDSYVVLNTLHGISNGDLVALHHPKPPSLFYNYTSQGHRILRAPKDRSAAKQWHEYLDVWDTEFEKDPAAGRQFNPAGEWLLGIPWVSTTSPYLHIKWDRAGGETFFEERIEIEPNSLEIRRLITVPPEPPGNPGHVRLSIALSEGAEMVLLNPTLDRIDQENETILTDSAINILRQLNPEYLRGHYNQLGASWGGTRQLSSRSLENRDMFDWHPKMEEFLVICQELGANPWIIGPTHASLDDWDRMHSYILTWGFTHTMLEFGNEVWGSAGPPNQDPWMGVSMGREPMCARAEEVFAHIGPHERISRTLGSQWGVPAHEVTGMIAQRCPNVDTIAVGAYWGAPLNSVWTGVTADYITRLHNHINTKGDKQLAIYECGEHTNKALHGWTLDQLNEWLESEIHEIAYKAHLEFLLKRVDGPVCVFAANGFSSPLQAPQYGHCRLWGVVRDWNTGELRPSGRVLVNWDAGEVEEPEPEPDDIQPLVSVMLNRTTGKLEVQIGDTALTIDAKELGL